MFYAEEIDMNTLRFGDVVQGYVGMVPYIENPINSNILRGYEYKIESYFPEFSVIMTPCCSIGKNTISLVPLNKITSDIYGRISTEVIKNFELLNSKIEPEKLYAEEIWEKYFDDQRRAEETDKGKALAYLEYFFYKGHDIFEEYEIIARDKKYIINDYLIDFKEIYQVKCNKIIRDNIKDEILSSKCLQLSIKMRGYLRDKLSYYYGRIPKEDII